MRVVASATLDHTMSARRGFPFSMRSSPTAGVALIALQLFFTTASIGSAQRLSPPPPALTQLASDKNYVDVSNFPHVHLSLRYASENNFMKRNVYGEFRQCFLHQIAAEKFRLATSALEQEKPGWKFLVFDCLRPRSIQIKLFDVVKGTPQEPYVANPKTGSLHNYGFAIDLSLEDEHGNELDMGTGFDDFRPLSHPNLERENLKARKLTTEQLEHRLTLRKIMVKAGFIQLPIEWWHFDALSKEELKGHYKIVE